MIDRDSSIVLKWKNAFYNLAGKNKQKAATHYLVDEAAGADDAVLDGLRGDVFAVGEHDRVLVPPRDDQVACQRNEKQIHNF